MPVDQATLDYYAEKADDYASRPHAKVASAELEAFMAGLPAGGDVLDFGCGSAWAAHVFRQQGFKISAFDGSRGLADEALRRYGIDVEVGPFASFSAQAAFDGVWASFCLLHDTRAAMPAHLARLFTALRPGGLLYLGLKAGSGSRRDGLGRLYTYFSAEEMTGLLKGAGFGPPKILTADIKGMEGGVEPCLHIFANRP